MEICSQVIPLYAMHPPNVEPFIVTQTVGFDSILKFLFLGEI